MIIFIFPGNKQKYQTYLYEFYEIRKQIFCDKLNWVNSYNEFFEKDELDEEYNVTILYVDPLTDKVAGGVRLVPTLGNTLVHTVWSDMLPEKDDFRSPEIWEATRFCVSEKDATGRKSKFVNRVSLALMYSILDFTNSNQISSIISICEKKIVSMINVFSDGLDVISEKIDENGCEVSCILWSVAPEIKDSLEWARPFIGDVESLKIESLQTYNYSDSNRNN